MNLDDDIEIKSVASKKTIKFSDVILPVNGKLCKLEEASLDQFISWVQSVFPLTSEMLELFISQKSIKNKSDLSSMKNTIFEMIVLLHQKRWLFGVGEQVFEKETRWN